MSPASTITAGYLILGLVPLLAGGFDLPRIGLALAHLVACALLLYLGRRDRGERISLGSWLPLLIIPILYAELAILNQWGGTRFFDIAVQGWEAILFPGNPSATLAGYDPSWVISEPLHFAYVCFYPLVYLPTARLHLQRRAEAFHRTITALMLGFLLCYVVYILFPVQGPRYLSTGPVGIPDGPFRLLALAFLEVGSSQGSAFPSSHVAVVVAQALMALRYQRWTGWVIALLSGGVAVGAVYGGFHYGVDIVAGVVVGVVAYAIALAIPIAGSRAPSARRPSPSLLD
jgi:membrane-associated phospholipid phosphatase